MTNSKNLPLELIIMLLALGNAGYSSVIKAGGLAVIDMANIKQTTITALKR
jgi:conjugal transfer/entry exclusion protein